MGEGDLYVAARLFLANQEFDGVGFNLDAVPSDRYGLAGIRERAQLFGGGATIESSLNKGTRVTVKLSLDVPPDEHSGDHADWTWTT